MSVGLLAHRLAGRVVVEDAAKAASVDPCVVGGDHLGDRAACLVQIRQAIVLAAGSWRNASSPWWTLMPVASGSDSRFAVKP